MNYNFKIFSSLDELSEYFSNYLSNQVDLSNDKFNLVLSGGSTPKYIFQYLASYFKEKIDWNKINIFWGDERCVPPDNLESNFKMADESLLSKINIPEKNIFRIKGEEKPEKEAERYSKVIEQNIPLKNSKPRFDLIMLGLGEDGHTASIFPDQLSLLEEENICSVSVHPVTKQNRITLTGKVINNAKNIVFIATGKNKGKIVSEILNNKNHNKKYPADFIKTINGNMIWLLDESATSLLV
ncbi:MAG: 6-phosphogluconolactonase [Ignavibacteriota bacterium]